MDETIRKTEDGQPLVAFSLSGIAASILGLRRSLLCNEWAVPSILIALRMREQTTNQPPIKYTLNAFAKLVELSEEGAMGALCKLSTLQLAFQNGHGVRSVTGGFVALQIDGASFKFNLPWANSLSAEQLAYLLDEICEWSTQQILTETVNGLHKECQ